MSAFIMVVFILEVKTEWISYSSSDWKIVERQQGIIALLLYQVQTVSPVRWLSNGRDLQRPSIPNTFFKHPVEIWGVLLYDKRKEYSGGKNV